MKIRIRENSIRLRLTKTEVETFAKEGYIENKTAFGFTSLIYALQTLGGIENLAATYIGDKITIFMPSTITDKWINTDAVGFNDNMAIGNGEVLFLLVEKDWACSDNAMGEDQSDNFKRPNPIISC